MSSTYSPICLSHDPGIVLAPELTYAEANSLNGRDRLEGHEHCDIVIGRFSYPLIEVACLGRQLPGPSGCKGHHGGPQWIDRDWLRLLLAATTPPSAVHPEVLRPLLRGCWPLERLGRLRNELGLPAEEQVERRMVTVPDDDDACARCQHHRAVHTMSGCGDCPAANFVADHLFDEGP